MEFSKLLIKITVVWKNTFNLNKTLLNKLKLFSIQ